VGLFKHWQELGAAALRRALAGAASAALGGGGGAAAGAAFGGLAGGLFALTHADGRFLFIVTAFCAAAGLAAGAFAGAFYGLHEGRVLGGSLWSRFVRREAGAPSRAEPDKPEVRKDAGRPGVPRPVRLGTPAAPWRMRGA
jgi:hypothetical protein